MTRLRVPITELLDDLRPDQALCAFNVETFDTLRPALEAAADVGSPVVVSWTVPAARYYGYDLISEIVGLLADRYGARHALHLDHCESADEIRAAAEAGFTSANYLNEGAISPEVYVPTAQVLRRDLDGQMSMEFVLGELGHVHDNHDMPRRAATLAEVQEFVAACDPDIVGFECGSLHGMEQRQQQIDIALIQDVARSTRLPIVLHGSSGVHPAALRSGIDAGLRKINIETAIRAAYVSSLREALARGDDTASKPRKITMVTAAALRDTYTRYLTDLTLRKA